MFQPKDIEISQCYMRRGRQVHRAPCTHYHNTRKKNKKDKNQSCPRLPSPCLNSTSPSPRTNPCAGREKTSTISLEKLCIHPRGRRENRLSTSQEYAKNNTEIKAAKAMK